MRFSSLFTAATTALVITVGGAPAAYADINLPTGNCGFAATNNCLVFDDFNVYSLAVLNQQAGFGPISPNDPYDVSTNGNALQNALVIGTGVSGAGSINTDIITNGGVDNAYQTPNSNGGTTNFATDGTNPLVQNSTQGLQGAAIVNNSPNTWDINVSDLVTYLDGGKLGFFFNLNQTNTTSYLNNPEDALGWMAVTLTDTTPGGNGSVTFWLDGNACDGPIGDPTHCDPGQSYPQNNAEDSILPADPNHDEWAYIHGQVCMSPAGAIVGFGPCAAGDHTNTTVNQNLGADKASFAMYSDLLQQALMSGLYDKMSVDFRMAAIDNGYEQLLIFSALNIPEPITVMIFGAGLLGLAGLRRRKLRLA